MNAAAASLLDRVEQGVSAAEPGPGILDRLRSAVPGTERKTQRVQLELPPRSMERLSKLKESTEAASYAEVIRNAIRLYEAMVSEASAGREFYIKDKSGTITPYKVFLEP